MIRSCLAEFANCLESEGIVAVTFIHAESGGGNFAGTGWVYPDVVQYTPKTILRVVHDAGLVGRPIPWYHPRQTWYVLGKSPDRVPSAAADRYLTGAVLFDREFAESLGGEKGRQA